MQRTLRSKRLRALLWQASGGVCPRCGGPLGDDWQADHIVPWKQSQRTNVHEMQALCAECNRKKGATMERTFQREARELCQRIKAYTSGAREVLVEVVPGGGKSVLPVILASELVPSRADAVCWIVPRQSLQEQAEAVFQDELFRRMFNHGLEIRQSTNDLDPCRGKVGFVTTYQAVQANPEALKHEFSRGRRYILVLDEPHHVEEGGVWHRALQPLVERSTLLVLMSGTMERGDGKRIAFVPYEEKIGGALVDFSPTATRAVLRYPRQTALREHAVKPLHFHHVDARAEWIDRQGATQRRESFEHAGKHDTASMIWTALRTEYAYQLLEKTVEDWRITQEANPRAKLLVVAATIGTARDYLKRLRKMGVPRADIATSDESEAARQAIRRFKRANAEAGSLEALVTVQMAYEGLDVQAITHVACLTHIRSRPWIEQMLARAARVDRSADLAYELQFGSVWGPDDVLLRDILGKIRAEQAAFIQERSDAAARDAASRAEDEEAQQVVPIASEAGARRMVDLGTGDSVDAVHTTDIEAIARQLGIRADAVQLMRFHEAMLNRERVHGGLFPKPIGPVPAASSVLPSQREASLRASIETACRRLDRQRGVEPGTHNRLVVAEFKKSRREMSEDELSRVWRWLQDTEARDGAPA